MPSSGSDPLSQSPSLPLGMLRDGDVAFVADVRGGRGMRRRMADMGLATGARIEVVSDSASSGPVIVKVLDSRIAIGRGMSRRIMVRPG
mgnify:CR=1 FL=1